jgi:aryl-phospho-beta-D-glucosidase BglC (GH1 family)
MGRGINVGNTMEATPTEGSWGNSFSKYFYDDFSNAGFTCIRIPITWKFHTSINSPYTVNPKWMARIDTIVTWGLNKGLYIIINMHHEVGLKGIDTMANVAARIDTFAKYDSIWSQIATHFKGKSDHLLFEILNEPIPMSQAMVDSFNSSALRIIRKTNPTRIVLYSGNQWSRAAQLEAAKSPNKNDKYLIGYHHPYDPSGFAVNGTGTFGTASDISSLKTEFSQITTWSNTNNLPITADEMGAPSTADYNSRMIYYAAIVEDMVVNGEAFNVWDDNGSFKTYLRSTHSWDDTKDIIIHTYKESPTQLKLAPNDTTVTLTWVNRTILNDSIFVDRRTTNTSFAQIAAISPSSSKYYDSTLSRNTVYYYRLRTWLKDSIYLYSYPQSVSIAKKLGTRKPFLGSPIAVPGTIQAEDFDYGGQAVAYNDKAGSNQGGAFRPTEGVGIEALIDSTGYQLDYVSDGEWTSYTIDCAQKGPYRIDTYTASQNGGGTYYFRVGPDSSKAVTVPKTSDWTTQAVSKTYQFNLDTGVQILYFVIAKGTTNPYNIDKFIFTPDTSTSIPSINKNNINIYPNPAITEVTVQADIIQPIKLDVYNLLGVKIKSEVLMSKETSVSLDGIGRGIYIFVLTTNNSIETKQIIVKK